MKKNSTVLLAGLALLAFLFQSCHVKDEKKADKTVAVDDPKTVKDVPGEKGDCDSSKWKYVYNPDRLEVLEKCKTVTGVIEESNADEDGDQHMLLKLDDGQDDLLTKKNRKKKDGDLVIEAVCANKVSLEKVGNTCDGYTNNIQIPNIGQHVKVTGSLVIDSHNGWAEIHPITKLEVLK